MSLNTYFEILQKLTHLSDLGRGYRSKQLVLCNFGYRTSRLTVYASEDLPVEQNQGNQAPALACGRQWEKSQKQLSPEISFWWLKVHPTMKVTQCSELESDRWWEISMSYTCTPPHIYVEKFVSKLIIFHLSSCVYTYIYLCPLIHLDMLMYE